MSLAVDQLLSYSTILAGIQKRSDAPFGMLFLRITLSPLWAPSFEKKVTTQTNDETSNDGTSKLDPIYDEDEDDDEEVPEKY